jgi:hypothetical protein
MHSAIQIKQVHKPTRKGHLICPICKIQDYSLRDILISKLCACAPAHTWETGDKFLKNYHKVLVFNYASCITTSDSHFQNIPVEGKWANH